MNIKKIITLIICINLQVVMIYAQSASIIENMVSIDTYSYDKPNPVPNLSDNSKIFPYFKFDEYEYNPRKKEWRVVTLENEYIKVQILPEIGGKVWGAIEKKTGEEFLYKNEVIKFRNIAMRGPWTSGGIEFNFGIIGHSPATASPVDYKIQNNEDGSVTCVIGNMDLPSRTYWTVEVNLQKDKAYFETKASWYNGTPINQSYYNWMTAAAVSKEDLEFFIPGNQFLEHNGNAKPWPMDEKGRELSFYKNNNFGSHKSYHIVGDYKDFFGGYYHDSNFGFGHWSPYEEMPGQKLWLWALSRSGGIWEDLLTDTDGQYIEFQAGRLFNQFFPGGHNPITQANFDPYVMDRWREIWFPFKDIGGMVDASEYGVLNVEKEKDGMYIGINALQRLNENFRVLLNNEEVINENINLAPLEVLSKKIPFNATDKVEVFVGNSKLYYTTDKNETHIKRPFYADAGLKVSKSQRLFSEGWEAMKFREYSLAMERFIELNTYDPSHQEALVKLAELEYRRANYTKALGYANKALKRDTYNPGANYMAGIIYHKQKDVINALESLGWAARDMKYRSAAYAQMAEIYFSMDKKNNAKEYAMKALAYNKYNINAIEVALIVARIENDTTAFNSVLRELKEINPLNHFSIFESFFMKNGVKSRDSIAVEIENEFSAETILEVALQYHSLGLKEETIKVLSLKENDVKVKLWLAYVWKDFNEKKSSAFFQEVLNAPIDFVFPYRTETVPVIEWALGQSPNWKWKYYLAQNYIAIGNTKKGKQLLKECDDKPTSDIFYRFRAKTLKDVDYKYRLKDYQNALLLDKNDWKIWEEHLRFYLDNDRHEEALKLSYKAFKEFPKNYNIELCYAQALLDVKSYQKSINVLKKSNILPFELANEGKDIYNQAHLFLAKSLMDKKQYKKAIPLLLRSKEWPEHLGAGKPYNPDSRVQDYLLAICYEKTKDIVESNLKLQEIVEYTNTHIDGHNLNNFYGLLAHDRLKNVALLSQLKESLEEQSKENLYLAMALAIYNEDALQVIELKKKVSSNPKMLELMESLRNQF